MEALLFLHQNFAQSLYGKGMALSMEKKRIGDGQEVIGQGQ